VLKRHAFLLYRPYAMAHLNGTQGPETLSYAWRRTLRILPAYWTALTLLALWPGLKAVFSADWWIYYGLLQAFWSPTLFSGLSVAWSLTIEASFYALLPLLAMFFARLGKNVHPRSRMVRQL